MRKQVSEFKANTSEYKKEFTQANYSRISVTIPKGQESNVKAHAEKRGLSVNGLVNLLLRSDMGLSVAEWKGKEESPSSGV